MTASNRAFSAFSFIAFVVTLIPFAWHLEAWNTGTCILMGWVSMGSLILFINSVVWNGNAINWAPIYCDITTKIIVGLGVGIPASLLCINRRLYHIVRVNSVTRTVSEKRLGVMVDLGIGIGIPAIVMILHVVVQGHRFNIYGDIGCQPETYNTWLAFALISGPTLGLALLSSTYSILSIIALKKNYTDFKQLLSSNGTNSSATMNRYIRLMCMAGLELMLDVPLNVLVIAFNVKSGVKPWVSWSDTHFDFNRFDAFPRFQWAANPAGAAQLELLRWSIVIVAFIFFGFFGFADEAIKHYKLAYNFFARRFGWRLSYIPGSTPQQQKYSGSCISSGRTWGIRGVVDENERKGAMKGTESWMNSFDEFASKVKLVVLPSGGTSLKSAKSTTSLKSGTTTKAKAKKGGLPVFVTKEIIERRDTRVDFDSTSLFTQITEFSYCSNAPQDEEIRSISSSSSSFSSREHSVDTTSQYSQFSPTTGASGSSLPAPTPALSSTPRPAERARVQSTCTSTSCPPPTPLPKDSIYYSSPLSTGFTLRVHPPPSSPYAIHSPQTIQMSPVIPTPRTPPKQMVPSSPMSTPNGSFLDLRASVISEVSSPLRSGISPAENRV